MQTLQSDACVNPLHMEAAGTHATALIQGFHRTIELAAAASVPRRLEGKQPPAADSPAPLDIDTEEVRRRHSTKKPISKQSTLFGHGFIPVRKGGKAKN